MIFWIVRCVYTTSIRFLCFIKPKLGNHYGPGVSSSEPSNTMHNDWRSLTSLVLFRPVGVPSRRTFVCWHEPSLRKAAPKWMLLNGLLIWCEAHKLPFLVELKTSKRSKLANDKGWSLMNLPVKCHFSNHKFDIQWFFQGNALSMFLMQLLNIFCLRVWSIRCDRRKDSKLPWKFSGFSGHSSFKWDQSLILSTDDVYVCTLLQCKQTRKF